MLKFYNTLSKKKEPFKPMGKKVGLYTCGPTVYWYAHIGNLRAYLFADVLARTLKHNDLKINWVMNITDVDDKTIKGSKKEYANLNPKQALKKFTRHYEKLFWQDLKKLNILNPDHTPRATETIKEMQQLIKNILKQGYGYIKDGSIYFDVKKYTKDYKYGQLIKLDLKKLKTGSRIEADEYKKEDLQDFVLWKAQKPDEPSWDFKIDDKNYPGRPGWHIECSAMSKKYLGTPFDIHTGGVDLKFPHHEDEIAQSSVGYQCQKPINFWLHNDHVLVDNRKMSKSLNNFYVLNDLIKKGFNPLAYRYLTLNLHYRSKFNFTWKGLKAAQNALDNLYQKTEELISDNQKEETKNNYQNKFLDLINDDLNTPKALALTWQLIKDEKISSQTKYRLLLDFDKVLGLGLDKIKKHTIPIKVKKLVASREKYRQNENWQAADRKRKTIEQLGYQVEDTEQGPKVKRAT